MPERAISARVSRAVPGPASIALAVIAALVVSPAQAEPPPGFWTVPPDTVAFWACDPGALAGAAQDRNRDLLEATLAWAIPASVGARPSPLLEAIRNLAAMGASPYQLALLKCSATSPPPVRDDPRPAVFDELEAVLVIEHPGDSAAVVTALRARVGKDAVEGDFPLPSDRKGHRLALKPGGSAVEWCDDHGSLAIGVGAGTLSHWFSLARNAQQDPTAPYGTSVQNPGRVALLGWVNLNALRESSPELFAYGRYARLLQAWELSNSRSLYLSGRVVPNAAGRPPLLALRAAWSPRSEPTNSIHSADLSASAWPASLTVAAPVNCTYAIVLNADWRALFNGAIGTAEALTPSPTAFQAQYRRWASDHSSALVGAVKSLDDHAVIFGPAPASHSTAAVFLARPGEPAFGSAVAAFSAALTPTAIRNGVTGGFRLKSDHQPPPPWAGLQWAVDPSGKRVTLSWPADAR